nr:HU family DNA-binding protein [Streptomyces agglomeratus]
MVDSIADLLGGRQAAGEAVQAVFEAIARAVAEGDRVMVTGFGSFERAERAARYARNPQTGEPVFVKETSVPKFRPGQSFKDLVSGSKKLPRGGKTAVRKAPKGSLTGSASPTAKKATKTGAKESTAVTTAAAKKATAKKAPVKTAPAKKAPAKKATAKKAPSKAVTTSTSAKARH